MNTPRFEFWRSQADGQWYFHFRAANGKLVCQSEGYTRKAGCLNGIKSIWRACVLPWPEMIEIEPKDRVKSPRRKAPATGG